MAVKSRGAESERMVCEYRIIPAAIKTVQFVEKARIRIIGMNLVRTDANNGTYADLKMSSKAIQVCVMER